MKHIIDIDEDMYKQVIANDTVYVLDDIDLIMLENAIAEGKPLREELEEIKAEIKPLRYGSDTYKHAIDDVFEILDNRIAELKGEQK